MAETKFLDIVGLTHLLKKTNVKFSKLGHTHKKSEITDFAHTHDDRYYTESEVDSKLSGKAASSHKHGASDITSVNASAINGVIATANLPSFVDDVIEGYLNDGKFYKTKNSNGTYATNIAAESGKIYVNLNDNKTYRWGGSAYVVISETIALGETSSTAYRGDRGKVAYDHAAAKGSAFASGLYKITTNAQGHVTGATAVQKRDITGLGIPAQDTVYTHPTSSGNKHIPSGGSAGQFLKWSADGTAVWAAISKGTVGLGNVDNTADSDKSVKYATSAGSASSAGSVAWSNVSGRPSSMPASDVYSWAKASSKPSYSAGEVGAVPTSRTVNGKALSSNITLSAGDVGAAASSHSHKYAGSSSAGGDANWAKGSTYANYSYNDKPITTAGTGAAYTASVSGLTLVAGASFVMVPHSGSTTTTPTLNVNSLGAKDIRMRLSSSTSSTIRLISANFLAANKPVRVVYDGTYWVLDDFAQPDASRLYGTLISRGTSEPSNGTDGFIYIQTT